MGKAKDKKVGRFLIVLSIVSFLVTFAEGLCYYSTEVYRNSFFRFLLIIQNSIKAFGFKSEISIKDVLSVLNENASLLEAIIGYAYAVAVFTAPYCTLAFCYKVLEKWLRLRNWGIKHKKWKHIIIFGYNDEVKALLGSEYKEFKKKRQKIYLVSNEVPSKEELELLKSGITIHNIDCLKLSPDQLKYFFARMELQRADVIVLFEESSARNFSLYHMFHSKENHAALKEGVKFYCRCEDDGIRRIVEDYYDTEIRMKGPTQSPYSDLELVSMPELRVRKMLEDCSLHQYYLGTDKPLDEWKLHLLIIGFGRMGQQILLQAMNLGVVSSKNPILIDVVDFNLEQRKSIFANNFSSKYVKISENEFSIPSDKADGELRIRFFGMDIRYKEFQTLLKKNGNPDGDGLYTNVAICIRNPEISLYCMAEVERYLRENAPADDAGRVRMNVRMETDKQMAKYLRDNKSTYSNVFVIEEDIHTITLDDLLNDTLDRESRKYNEIYNSILVEAEKQAKSSLKTKKNNPDNWSELELFKKNSNRALAYHDSVKSIMFEKIEADYIERMFGENGRLLKKVGDTWHYGGSIEEFAEELSDCNRNPFISEMVRMEHRRWCYFMASTGWKKGSKDEVNRINPCMCPWDELRETHADTCMYDLMPLLIKCKMNSEEKEKG